MNWIRSIVLLLLQSVSVFIEKSWNFLEFCTFFHCVSLVFCLLWRRRDNVAQESLWKVFFIYAYVVREGLKFILRDERSWEWWHMVHFLSIILLDFWNQELGSWETVILLFSCVLFCILQKSFFFKKWMQNKLEEKHLITKKQLYSGDFPAD